VRRALVIALMGAALAVPAAAEARARVDVMVVGKARVHVDATRVVLQPRTARVGGRRCALGAATPLSALAGAGVGFRLEDYGRCSRRARDAGSLYVERIAGERASGRDGWVYKVGRRVGSTGAGDPSGPFGTGRRLRHGQDVLWFWCVQGASDSCQRTLEVTPAGPTVAPGAPLAVRVRGYDDAGRGVAVAGATVRLGSAVAQTGADGSATLTAPAAPARVRLEAETAGMVRAFPREVRVG